MTNSFYKVRTIKEELSDKASAFLIRVYEEYTSGKTPKIDAVKRLDDIWEVCSGLVDSSVIELFDAIYGEISK